MADVEAPTTGGATSEIRKEIQERPGTRDLSKVLIVLCYEAWENEIPIQEQAPKNEDPLMQCVNKVHLVTPPFVT